MCDFRKQPVSPPRSDNELMPSDGHEKPRQISLLSSLLSEHSSPSKPTAATGGYVSGPSAPSSSPSTAFSSPRAHPEPISILRRGSNSDGEPFHLGLARVTPTSPSPVAKLEPTMDKPHTILLQEPTEKPSAADKSTASARRPSLKFAVAQPRPFVDRVPIQVDDDDTVHTDPGYEEDSEDGFSDDEPTFMMQAMARAREARIRNAKLPVRPASASPPPRTQPPPRRGRGHIRVDPAAGNDHEQCTRHCSPPPSDARSTRSAPPGPRDGRAGSPVPSKHSDDDDDDEDDDDDDEEDDNDDNANQDDDNDDDDDCPGLEPMPNTHDDNDNAFLTDSDDAESQTGLSAGVKKVLRRASEHLPTFRRLSFTVSQPDEQRSTPPSAETPPSTVPIGRSKSMSARPPNSSLRMGGLSGDERLSRSRPVACPARP